MFTLETTSIRRRLTSLEIAAYVALAAAAILTLAVPQWAGFSCIGWFFGAAVISAIGSLHRRRLRKIRGGDTLLFADAEAISILEGRRIKRIRRWDRLRRVSFKHRCCCLHAIGIRPLRRMPTTTPTTWRLRIPPSPWLAVSRFRHIDVRLTLTRREAALVRNTMRRRIRAARAGRCG